MCSAYKWCTQDTPEISIFHFSLARHKPANSYTHRLWRQHEKRICQAWLRYCTFKTAMSQAQPSSSPWPLCGPFWATVIGAYLKFTSLEATQIPSLVLLNVWRQPQSGDQTPTASAPSCSWWAEDVKGAFAADQNLLAFLLCFSCPASKTVSS